MRATDRRPVRRRRARRARARPGRADGRRASAPATPPGVGGGHSCSQSSSAPASPRSWWARSRSPAVTVPAVPAAALAGNPTLDPGTPIHGAAPNFTLIDQFGRAVSLSSFRGKVVILAFNDPQCTTICPLTTTAMVKAKRLLGPAGAQVELLGVGANPAVTETRWVRAYSQAHGMMHAWHFLNGPLAAAEAGLARVRDRSADRGWARSTTPPPCT